MALRRRSGSRGDFHGVSLVQYEHEASSRTIVSSAFKYSAGSFCLITAGTNRTALMKGISSRTAQLDTLHVSQRHWNDDFHLTYRCKSPILIGDLNSTIPR